MSTENIKVTVSVLMTAYNREKYIGEAIESVLNSKYQDFELIIVDDCSSDRTLEIAKAYEKTDPRIKVYHNSTNLGQFANRNKAASYAQGKYLKYLDSDDSIIPECLQEMVDAMEKYSDAGMGFCHTIGKTNKQFPFKVQPQESFITHFFQGGLLFTGPSGVIFKTNAFENVGGFEEFGMPSDNHLNLKIAARYPVVAVREDLFIWRQHDEQVFSVNKKNYFNIIHNYKFTADIIKRFSPLNEKENKKVMFNQKKILFLNLFRLSFRKGKPILALRILKQLSKS